MFLFLFYIISFTVYLVLLRKEQKLWLLISRMQNRNQFKAIL